MLTQSELKRLLHYDPQSGQFRWRSGGRGYLAGDVAGHTSRRDGRVTIRIRGRLYMAHRLAWFYVHGKWPEGLIDHINRDASDNRIENLREATQAQNLWNRGHQHNSGTGFKGVTFDKRNQRYRAKIAVRGIQICLGRYDTAEEAAQAYAAAAAKHHGNFAYSETLPEVRSAA